MRFLTTTGSGSPKKASPKATHRSRSIATLRSQLRHQNLQDVKAKILPKPESPPTYANHDNDESNHTNTRYSKSSSYFDTATPSRSTTLSKWSPDCDRDSDVQSYSRYVPANSLDVESDSRDSDSESEYDPLNDEDRQAIASKALSKLVSTILLVFLKGRTGGGLTDNIARTVINRVVMYLCWTHQKQYGHEIECETCVDVFQTLVKLHNDMPSALDEYIDHLSQTFQLAPATILSHLDAIEKMFLYMYIYTSNTYSPPDFKLQWQFTFTQCRRSVRKERKVSGDPCLIRFVLLLLLLLLLLPISDSIRIKTLP